MVVIIHKKVVIKYVKGSYYPSYLFIYLFLKKLSFFVCVGFRFMGWIHYLNLATKKKKRKKPPPQIVTIF